MDRDGKKGRTFGPWTYLKRISASRFFNIPWIVLHNLITVRQDYPTEGPQGGMPSVSENISSLERNEWYGIGPCEANGRRTGGALS